MKENITIQSFNTKGQLHGYNEWYNQGHLTTRANWKNGRLIGYAELPKLIHDKPTLMKDRTQFYIR